MIEKVKINNVKKLPKKFGYAENLEWFNQKNPEINLKSPGTNIIIGSNGCGKSTLLDIIASYTLCKSGVSKLSKGIGKNELLDLFDISYKLDLNNNINSSDEFLDGADIIGDYKLCTFKMVEDIEKDKEDIMSDISSFSQLFYNKRSSSGETLINTLGNLFETMNFKSFPLKDINNLSEDIWGYWKKKILNYIKKNHRENKNPSFTVLIDEPDRNLDLYNIQMIQDILETSRSEIQLICVVHNPLLIYRLSKNPNINIIEMTPGYLNKLKEMIEKL